VKSSRSAKGLIPIFPDRLEPATAQHCGDFSWGTFVADLELTGRELIFTVLVFGRDDAAAYGAMQMFAALPGLAAGLSVSARAHHRHPD
jgi:hypothetical protein